MKSRIFDSEDVDVLGFDGAQESLGNDAGSRMWFKRQFFEIRKHISSRRI